MKEELWESFPPRRDGATRGMRADGESREQQQQQQQWRRRWWRRRRGWRWRRRRREAWEEPAALPEEAAVGQLPRRRRQDVPQHEEGGVFLPHAVPLQGGLHQQHHLPHVRLQGGCTPGGGACVCEVTARATGWLMSQRNTYSPSADRLSISYRLGEGLFVCPHTSQNASWCVLLDLCVCGGL